VRAHGSFFKVRWGLAATLVTIAYMVGSGRSAAQAKSAIVVTPLATPTEVRTSISFESFRIIGDRNIFDPSRTGRNLVDTAERLPSVDLFTLVGTMQYEKGVFAFFDGSSAPFRKALHEGERIADYTIRHIASDGVDLARGGQPLHLNIGQQMRRPAGGEWTAASADSVREESPSAPTANVTPASLPIPESDVLQRLLKQRQKQMTP
jgi:hypothetical protein